MIVEVVICTTPAGAKGTTKDSPVRLTNRVILVENQLLTLPVPQSPSQRLQAY